MVCCVRTAAWAGCREAQVPGSFFLALSSVTRASQNFAELLQDLPGPSILSDILLEVLAGLLGCQAFRETGGSIQVPRDVYRALFQLSLQPGWSHKHQRLTSAWHSWQCGSRPIRCYHPIFVLFSQFLLDISGITNSRGPICMWIYVILWYILSVLIVLVITCHLFSNGATMVRGFTPDTRILRFPPSPSPQIPYRLRSSPRTSPRVPLGAPKLGAVQTRQQQAQDMKFRQNLRWLKLIQYVLEMFAFAWNLLKRWGSHKKRYVLPCVWRICCGTRSYY